MKEQYFKIIAGNLQVQEWQIRNTYKLLENDCTIPFISRYRKEATGSLDEVQIASVKDLADKFIELEKRRQSILESIESQEKLNPELKDKIDKALTLTELEDLYLPYKPKRRTKAMIAREKGLELLAKLIFDQNERNPFEKAKSYINENVNNVEEAIEGAKDIVAEWISENIRARNSVRNLFERQARVSSKVVKDKEEEAIKYKDYFEFDGKLSNCPSHNILALMRGQNEGLLKVSISINDEEANEILDRIFIKNKGESADLVKSSIKDSYKRLLEPSIETEYYNIAKEKADIEAIKVFASNLRQLLLAPPLGEKRILAIDPGYRTGCKVICLDAQGNFLHNDTIYPHKPQEEVSIAIKKIAGLVKTYKIDAIAIGNGTASRETEHFIKNKIKFDRDLQVFIVNESGASIYSASALAREEFPEYDVTVRGSISIGRRLMDPLSELVKIDPKSIGVGQYQHDVDQKMLKLSLDQVVESCVNSVGIDLNTASKQLLTYVSGLGPQLAQNIVDFRKENGPFKSRKELKKVKRMGEKAFEQSAGFLRIRNAENPLDNSAVHPESYQVVEKIAKDLNCSLPDLLKEEPLRKKIKLSDYVNEKVGLPTLTDIMNELNKPGRDPRGKIKAFEFNQDVHKIEDLQPGMILPGIVTNITNFGAFVDLGIKQDGLVHKSNMADKFVSDPSEIVQIHQHVKVKVIEVDIPRKRINLEMKGIEQ